MFGTIREECGVFGIFDTQKRDVAKSTYFALYALQHRGQESCGIAVNCDGVVTSHTGLGLVPEVFTQDQLQKLGYGNMAVGHVRYSSEGQGSASNSQPLVIRHVKGTMALANNGSLTNAHALRESFELNGGIFHSTGDAEVIAYAITESRLKTSSIEQAVEKAMDKLQGAYSFILMSPQKLIAARDPQGFHPLCMGKTEDGAILLASESCALTTLGAEFVRDIKPGEIVVVTKDGVNSIETHCKPKSSMCVFEFVYFARPDSEIEGFTVHEARKRAGAFLAKEHPVEADVVIGVPDSGLDAAMGYAEESGIPYGVGFIKNRYVGRSFIQPTQGEREDAVRIKLSVIRSVVSGKRVVMIDDSIVRGTTSARIVNLLREAGAKEVHMRVSSPPFIYPCYFGTDIDSQDKLIACRMSIPEIAESIHVDSLGYLSVESVNQIALPTTGCGFCDACFTGNYPVEVPACMPKDKFSFPIGKTTEK
ncbi:MAG TPA: amidophosphoribosyltransferase [Firmicutes bacterium]|nr:amidophosphoribosyltransferase [Bacillota bacterium]